MELLETTDEAIEFSHHSELVIKTKNLEKEFAVLSLGLDWNDT